ncbi:hypothetical protein NB640_08875 [Oxalobacter vibrioformis]|uniref:Lipoprotein n=1 Tax=Oxalobacter vibrioformis TaxID=933080 RepID=A0A9E9P3Q2_9BURK|nr:hypothetical protein [Oxalobacter vibrioformis]WAW09361.1 hypothetical protein NB640_08875 [Oxalobacter vibrioformis]
MKTDISPPLVITGLLFSIFLSIALLGGCNQEKNKTAENSYIIVSGEILPATDHIPPPACHASPVKTGNATSGCQDSKSIKLSFHRTNPDITMLTVTTDLTGLPAAHPGWHTPQESLTCSGTTICREQCHLTLTFTPPPEKPESTLYINYEYLVNGQKALRKNRVSIVYAPSKAAVSSEEIS